MLLNIPFDAAFLHTHERVDVPADIYIVRVNFDFRAPLSSSFFDVLSCEEQMRASRFVFCSANGFQYSLYSEPAFAQSAFAAIFDNDVNYDRHFDIPVLAKHIMHRRIAQIVSHLLAENLSCWRPEFFPKFPNIESV